MDSPFSKQPPYHFPIRIPSAARFLQQLGAGTAVAAFLLAGFYNGTLMSAAQSFTNATYAVRDTYVEVVGGVAQTYVSGISKVDQMATMLDIASPDLSYVAYLPDTVADTTADFYTGIARAFVSSTYAARDTYAAAVGTIAQNIVQTGKMSEMTKVSNVSSPTAALNLADQLTPYIANTIQNSAAVLAVAEPAPMAPDPVLFVEYVPASDALAASLAAASTVEDYLQYLPGELIKTTVRAYNSFDHAFVGVLYTVRDTYASSVGAVAQVFVGGVYQAGDLQMQAYQTAGVALAQVDISPQMDEMTNVFNTISKLQPPTLQH